MSEEKKVTITLSVTEAVYLANSATSPAYPTIRKVCLDALEALKPPSIESKLSGLNAPWHIHESTGDVFDEEREQLTIDSSATQDKTIVNAPDAFVMLRRLYDDRADALKNAGYHDTIESLLERAGWL